MRSVVLPRGTERKEGRRESEERGEKVSFSVMMHRSRLLYVVVGWVS